MHDTTFMFMKYFVCTGGRHVNCGLHRAAICVVSSENKVEKNNQMLLLLFATHAIYIILQGKLCAYFITYCRTKFLVCGFKYRP